MYSQRLQKLTPYVPGEQPQDRTYIKLNTNENPYPPSPRVTEFLKKADATLMRRYPDPLFSELRSAIAGRYGVSPGQVFIGNGSDEVLSFAFYAFFDNINGPLLFPNYTYSFYPVYCDFYGIQYTKIPLDKEYRLDISAFISRKNACGIIFPNPNAPTGIAVSLEKIRSLLDQFPKNRVVIVDEAYVDFGSTSAVSLIDDFPNLLIVRTASKSMSLAGMRLGFAMGNEALVKALFTVKDSVNSYPVNSLTQKIGVLAMKDNAYYNDITQKIIRTRERFIRALDTFGWRCLPSSANFVFAGKPGISGKKIYESLKNQGILVRHFDVNGLRDFLRITIGTDEEMDKLTAVIRQKLC